MHLNSSCVFTPKNPGVMVYDEVHDGVVPDLYYPLVLLEFGCFTEKALELLHYQLKSFNWALVVLKMELLNHASEACPTQDCAY